MENQEKKENRGGARINSGRKSKGENAKTATLAISGTFAEITEIRDLAQKSNKSVSRFIIEEVLKK